LEKSDSGYIRGQRRRQVGTAEADSLAGQDPTHWSAQHQFYFLRESFISPQLTRLGIGIGIGLSDTRRHTGELHRHRLGGRGAAQAGAQNCVSRSSSYGLVWSDPV